MEVTTYTLKMTIPNDRYCPLINLNIDLNMPWSCNLTHSECSGNHSKVNRELWGVAADCPLKEVEKMNLTTSHMPRLL